MKVDKTVEQNVRIPISRLSLLNYLKKELDLPCDVIASLEFSDIVHHFVLPLIPVEYSQSYHEWRSQ